MRIVVTGSLGHISKPLTEELVQKGNSVTVISSNPERQEAIEALGAEAAIGSVEDSNFLAEIFTGADAVYCMVPPNDYFTDDIDPVEYYSKIGNNYAEAIQQTDVKRVIHLSSVGADLEKGSGLIIAHHKVENILKELPGDVAVTYMRPTAFYYNLYGFVGMIKNMGYMGANYGGEDVVPWVSPKDIASAIVEEIESPFAGRKVRYVASHELTCNEAARILGEAIGKPDLKWILISDEQTLNGMKEAGIMPKFAEGLTKMNAAIHSGLLAEDYNRNKPEKMGEIKMTDFAKEFALAFKGE